MTRKVTAIFWVAIGCFMFAATLLSAAVLLFGDEIWAVIIGG